MEIRAVGAVAVAGAVVAGMAVRLTAFWHLCFLFSWFTQTTKIFLQRKFPDRLCGRHLFEYYTSIKKLIMQLQSDH